MFKDDENWAAFFTTAKDPLSLVIHSVSELCDVLHCLESAQREAMWEVLLTNRPALDLLTSVDDFRYFIGFLDKECPEQKDRFISGVVTALKGNDYQHGLLAALIDNGLLPGSTEVAVTAITAEGFNNLYAICAVLVQEGKISDLVQKLNTHSASLTSAQCFTILSIQAQDGFTAVMLAVRYKPRGLSGLLDGLAPDQKLQLLNIQNKEGSTVLTAATHNHEVLIGQLFLRTLLEAGSWLCFNPSVIASLAQSKQLLRLAFKRNEAEFQVAVQEKLNAPGSLFSKVIAHHQSDEGRGDTGTMRHFRRAVH